MEDRDGIQRCETEVGDKMLDRYERQRWEVEMELGDGGGR